LAATGFLPATAAAVRAGFAAGFAAGFGAGFAPFLTGAAFARCGRFAAGLAAFFAGCGFALAGAGRFAAGFAAALAAAFGRAGDAAFAGFAALPAEAFAAFFVATALDLDWAFGDLEGRSTELPFEVFGAEFLIESLDTVKFEADGVMRPREVIA
jgi:hypothetical protein